MNIATILLARSGSKGLPGKNLKLLLGHPLIAYTIRPCQKSRYIKRTILSTDDPYIAAVAKDYGAEVPFLRPTDLAQDLTSSEASIAHALRWLEQEENYKVDILVYLQVTDLFKDVEQIDQCVEELILDPTLESAFLGYVDKKNYWREDQGKFVSLTPGRHMSRQVKPPVFREDTGLGCATRARLLVEEGRRLGDKVKVIPHQKVLVDIHTEFDFWMAEELLTKRQEYFKYRLD